MEKVIFFDFFGVICKEISPNWLLNFYDEENAKKLKEEIINKGDEGIYTEEEVFLKLEKLTNVPAKTIRETWLKNPIINEELVAFIEELKKKYKIYLLSNALYDFIMEIINRFSLDRLFDKMYISAPMKKAKPNKDYFEYVLTDLNIKGENAIFTDDNIVNINGAKACNINTIHFKDIGIDEYKRKIYDFLEGDKDE